PAAVRTMAGRSRVSSTPRPTAPASSRAPPMPNSSPATPSSVTRPSVATITPTLASQATAPATTAVVISGRAMVVLLVDRWVARGSGRDGEGVEHPTGDVWLGIAAGEAVH